MIGKQRFDLPGPLKADRIVNIPKGGVRDVADLLQKEGVIDQPWLFTAGALMMKAKDDLKYGEYRFVKSASLRDVVETIIEGKVVQHSFTMAEGLTSDQIVQRLLENDVLTGNIREIPREGTLLPETYAFTRGMTREQMIQRMQQAQRRAVQEIWERRMPDLPIRTVEQFVTLASIIEKETGKPEERTRVAAVFVNRLKQKMKLQSDPTIIYGLVGGKGALGRPIMRSEIEQPTPYNTYVIDGLPPGPIANPGRASLEAAANPARTKELFFVADGTCQNLVIDLSRGAAIQPEEVVFRFGRNHFVALAGQHIQRRLRADDLAGRGDQRRIAHVFSDARDFVEHFLHAIQRVLLR